MELYSITPHQFIIFEYQENIPNHVVKRYFIQNLHNYETFYLLLHEKLRLNKPMKYRISCTSASFFQSFNIFILEFSFINYWDGLI